MKIEISDGYPTEASIEALKNCSDVKESLDAAAEYFNECGYGKAVVKGKVYRFATGGWSGCEEVIGSLSLFVRCVAWRSSHRGGLHIYMVPE